MTAIIRNAVTADARAIFELNCAVYNAPIIESGENVIPLHSLVHHIERFGEGVFVADAGDRLAGFAITIRTSRNPQADPLDWWDAIGGAELSNHEPDGEWLYGVDFGVHPDFRKQGIGTQIYRARFEFVEKLGLSGFYAGGMLAGYHRYQQNLSVEEYGHQVRQREIVDPTLTMQMNRGFRPGAVIKNYCGDSPTYDNAMLIVWDNQQVALNYS